MAYYCHHRVWNSLHATGSVIVNGDMTTEKTEEEVGPVKLPTSLFYARAPATGNTPSLWNSYFLDIFVGGKSAGGWESALDHHCEQLKDLLSKPSQRAEWY